jgi:hypothetical protein
MCEDLSLTDPFRSLYPTKNDFSYVPRRAGAQHRSRLDFFIISDNLLQNCKDCFISDSLQSTLFDHKAIHLIISGTQTGHKVITNVSNKILKDPDAGIIVDLACKEAHLFYQDMLPNDKDRLLHAIGRCKKLLREAGPCMQYYKSYEEEGNNDADRANVRVQKLNELNGIRFQEDLCNILDNNLNLEEDFFFEMLLNHVKNELISYQ